jgi:hypothetical protein
MSTTDPAPYRIVERGEMAWLEQWHGPHHSYLIRAYIPVLLWLGKARPIFEAEIVRHREAAGQRRGSWLRAIKLSHQEGREALLLFWGLERATPEQIPVAIANWRGLAPEERWWLVSQADATRGTASYHPERGWRAAIVHILTENGV